MFNKVAIRTGNPPLLEITASIMTRSRVVQTVLSDAKPTMLQQQHRDRSPWQRDSVWYGLLFSDKSVTVADMTPTKSGPSVWLGLTPAGSEPSEGPRVEDF